MPPRSNPLPVFVPDDRQRAAIEHVNGPMLVVAGAGTGKTSVLTNRIARLVCEGHAQPGEILALTYTNNAACEMRERLHKLLGGKTVHAATFHDYCLELLKSAHQDFGVLDEQDIWIYLRRRIRDLRLEHFVRAANVGQFLSDLLKFIDRCHDELVTPTKYAEYVARLERKEIPLPRVGKSKDELSADETIARCREIARVFRTVEEWLQEDNLGTFSHMIVRAHALLRDNENMLAEARTSARFVLADEFQDANFAQAQILRLLTGPEGNIFAVGDPDQSIYRFRGASSAAFELFRRCFPQFAFVALEKNHRSTTPILRSAFALIEKNPPVFTKGGEIPYRRSPLESVRDQDSGETQAEPAPVYVVVLTGKDAEGPEITSFIRNTQKKSKCRWSDFGVLYRTHTHRDELVHELAEANIPFVIERMDISHTPEARDLFACVNAVVNTGDDVSVFRVAALARFQVKPAELRAQLRALGRERRNGKVVAFFSALDRVDGGSEVAAAIERTRTEIRRRQARARATLDIIVEQFGLDRQSLILQAALNFVAAWEQKEVNRTTELEELAEYLDYFSEAGGVIPLEAPEGENAVRLMTVHGAKGLEFPHVFILRANANSFPNSYRETLVAFPRELRDQDSLTEEDDHELHRQEERRLFYVAMTRARDSLRIYSREGRGKINKNPDGYMRELIDNQSLVGWFKKAQPSGAQKELNIFAEAAPPYPAASRTDEWFKLPVLPGLDSRLSASAVDTYERCGLQFRLERDWSLAAKPGAAMQYGASMHRVLKDYFDAEKAGRPRSEEQVIELFRSDLKSEGIQEAYQHDLYEKQGVTQLRDFLAAIRSASARDVLHTEEPFEIRIGNTTVAGRIDRIDRQPDGSVAIIDYKTGKARDQENADKSLQLSLYAIAAEMKWGYRVSSVSFYNLGTNVPVMTVRDESELQAARAKVEAAAKGIAANVFVAKTGMHCGFCAYRSLCPKQEKQIPQRVAALAAKH